MAFSSTRIFNVSPNLIQPIAEDVATQLSNEGYEVQVEPSLGNDAHISSERETNTGRHFEHGASED